MEKFITLSHAKTGLVCNINIKHIVYYEPSDESGKTTNIHLISGKEIEVGDSILEIEKKLKELSKCD